VPDLAVHPHVVGRSRFFVADLVASKSEEGFLEGRRFGLFFKFQAIPSSSLLNTSGDKPSLLTINPEAILAKTSRLSILNKVVF